MRRTIAGPVLLALTLLILIPVGPARAGDVMRTPGDPVYAVRLRGGATGRAWRGTETITFTNLDASPMTTIYLRLWSNGVLGCDAGAIVVSDVEGGTAGPQTRRCTVLPVALDAPLASGGTTTISTRLSIHLPIRNDRFGAYRGLSLLGTALPTLAVHDELGWHLDPFVDLGESFYSVVGDYRVTLNVPASLDTPTSGRRVSGRTVDSRRITTYEAVDVRDFEWAAGRLSRVADRVGDTRVNVWFQSRGLTRDRALRALDDATASLRTFSEAFGTFPYPEMDVVLTAFTSFGGMEYPTIIFTNTPHLTVSHEIAHQWWFGIVGDDEYAEPWLDEAFATWSQYLPFGGWKRCDSFDFPSTEDRLTNDMGFWNHHRTEYWTIYFGGGCLLANLASRFGMDRFLEVLRGYAAAHWLGVARTADFTDAVETAAVTDLPGFDPATYWAQWRVDVSPGSPG
jgi:hypothetical protein